MKTYFASSKLEDKEIIMKEYTDIQAIDYIQQIFNSIREMSMIINEYRQIIFINKSCLNFLNRDFNKNILGKRPGEVLNCIGFKETPSGCGTGKGCKYCKLLLTALESQKTNKQISEELSITIKNNEHLKGLELIVTASPFIKNNKKYTIINLEDVGDKKRKEYLERIFLHDLLNTAGNIHGFIDYLRIKVKENDMEEVISILEFSSENLIKQIYSHRDFLLAEKGNLIINKSIVNSKDFIKKIVKRYQSLEEYEDYKINLDICIKETKLETDIVLLTRVIENLIKNALEASENSLSITIGYKIKESEIIFFIKNSEFMSEEVSSQIFHRSFSTKGNNRGLGTYSVKLLTEEYLGGKVWFISNKNSGTTFFVSIPI